MGFDKTKQNSIRFYILEKISQQLPDLSSHVAEVFDINRNTAHRYINQLVEDGLIARVKRGKYELVKKTTTYEFLHPESESQIFLESMKPLVLEFPQNVQMIWEYAFTEMMNNVIDHSESKKVSVFVQQDALNTGVMILDNGVGIFQKLKTHFSLPTLEDAILELFKGKLTTDASRHSGEGIFFTSRIMDEFFIISDKKVFTHNKYEESTTFDFSMLSQGTAVFMSLSNRSQKTLSELFDRFSDVDGGFSKTTVTLKNIFDSAPVSRSQAKRVCDRLDQFSEITLDFDGIDWMGQGFAHQIFVLFASNHPEAKLVPINMNEPVSKMLNHVLNS